MSDEFELSCIDDVNQSMFIVDLLEHFFFGFLLCPADTKQTSVTPELEAITSISVRLFERPAFSTKNTQYEKNKIRRVLMKLTVIVFYTKIFSIMLFFLLNILDASNQSHIACT